MEKKKDSSPFGDLRGGERPLFRRPRREGGGLQRRILRRRRLPLARRPLRRRPSRARPLRRRLRVRRVHPSRGPRARRRRRRGGRRRPRVPPRGPHRAPLHVAAPGPRRGHVWSLREVVPAHGDPPWRSPPRSPRPLLPTSERKSRPTTSFQSFFSFRPPIWVNCPHPTQIFAFESRCCCRQPHPRSRLSNKKKNPVPRLFRNKDSEPSFTTPRRCQSAKTSSTPYSCTTRSP